VKTPEYLFRNQAHKGKLTPFLGGTQGQVNTQAYGGEHGNGNELANTEGESAKGTDSHVKKQVKTR